AYFRACGALAGDTINAEHPLVRAMVEVLENFREAYLTVARTLSVQKEWPIAESALVQRIRRQYATSLLLGEVRKPEGNSMITFGNAVSRYVELGHVRRERQPGARDATIAAGPALDRLPDLIRHLRT